MSNTRIRISAERLIDPLNLKIEDVDVEVLARALGREARFSGFPKAFLSVAEHSMMVARMLPAPLKLWGLLHDASEGYGFRDLARPIKHSPMFAGYRAAIGQAQDTIYLALVGAVPSVGEAATIKAVDTAVYDVEAACVWEGEGLAFYGEVEAAYLWLKMYRQLKGEVK